LPTSATTWLKDPSPSGWTCATPTAPTSPCSARSSACTRWPSKTHFDAVQSLDDCVEEIEDRLFDDIPHSMEVQRRSFQLRKSLVLLRRVVLPMREVVNAVMRRDLHVGGELVPYYQDVYDHVLRAAEWNDSLRDLVTSILETNVTIQGNRLNIITKKVTGWGRDHRRPHPDHRLLRDERALSRLQRQGRFRHLPRRHCPGRPGALHRLQAQRLAVGQ
jgi:hypothetical protein